MRASGTCRGGGIWVLAFLAAAGCQQAPTPSPEPDTVEQDGIQYRITGPFAHENLTVFLLHSSTQDQREFITLDQGLKEGVVKVTEQAQERVQELQIDNQSDQPLFLQEGDRLQGGKQDRTIYASLVVPAKSGNMTVPAFCIEQSRWRTGDQGGAHTCPLNSALAPKTVRCAAKFDKNQAHVWENVRKQKCAVEDAKLAGNTNSSLNEALDSPQVKKLSDEFATALAGVLSDRPDAVGVAIAINGKIEEVNVYPNHALLSKLYPRLLQSYALEATLEKDKAKDAPAVHGGEVVKFMTEGKAKEQRDEAINADNQLHLSDLGGNKACAATSYRGEVVHRQILSKDSPPEGAAAAQPSNLNNRGDQSGEKRPPEDPPPSRPAPRR